MFDVNRKTTVWLPPLTGRGSVETLPVTAWFASIGTSQVPEAGWFLRETTVARVTGPETGMLRLSIQARSAQFSDAPAKKWQPTFNLFMKRQISVCEPWPIGVEYESHPVSPVSVWTGVPSSRNTK